MDGCQLETLPGAGKEHTRGERLVIDLGRTVQKVARKLSRAPGALIQLGLPRDQTSEDTPPRPPPLGLVPGERVRVRSLEAIRRSLDEHRRCAGLSFMPVMERFCGRAFTVKRRVERFFDERTRRLLKVRDIVTLEDVYCEPALFSDADYGGCDRSCFLFWKEDWLERVENA